MARFLDADELGFLEMIERSATPIDTVPERRDALPPSAIVRERLLRHGWIEKTEFRWKLTEKGAHALNEHRQLSPLYQPDDYLRVQAADIAALRMITQILIQTLIRSGALHQTDADMISALALDIARDTRTEEGPDRAKRFLRLASAIETLSSPWSSEQFEDAGGPRD